MRFTPQIADFTFNQMCRGQGSLLSFGGDNCQGFFGISFAAAVTEWIFLGLAAYLFLHRLIIKPVFATLLRTMLVVSLLLLLSRLTEVYVAPFVPGEAGAWTGFVAQTVFSLSSDLIATLVSTVLMVFAFVKRTVETDAFPGETLARHLASYGAAVASKMSGSFST